MIFTQISYNGTGYEQPEEEHEEEQLKTGTTKHPLTFDIKPCAEDKTLHPYVLSTKKS